ncbi:hypothetical protein EDB81DRAFT_833653, partial [Dactylonectria macrodidyma]
MPRPRIDLTPLRQDITILIDEDSTISNIILSLSTNYNIQVSRAVLYRFLQKWELLRQRRTVDTEPLRERIKSMFFDECLKDAIILRRLQDEGFSLSLTGLCKIRRELGLFRRQDNNQLQIAQELARTFFHDESQVSTVIQNYDRRDALYNVYRDFAPESITDRWGKARFQRREFIVPGPDWVWSLDGYDKLKQWGFEIYAGIDGYARYITWFYCGYSAATSWNVALQYLSVLRQRGMMPRAIRSDHGGETALMCGLHYFLSGNRKKRLGTELVPIEFKDCWFFGRSIHNTRIESWWHRLYQARGGSWR